MLRECATSQAMIHGKPVVVGTDLSTTADEAVRQAAHWASEASSRLVVVHVASESTFANLDPEKAADAIRQRVDEATAGSADIVVESGSAASRLIDVADARDAGLVVVGASGAGGVAEMLFGSTAEQVVRYAHCPVLVARPSPSSGPVLAATDFSHEATPAVDAAAAIANARQEQLVLLHSIYEPPSPLEALGPLVFSPPQVPQAEVEAWESAARETLSSLLESTGTPGQVVVTHGAPGRSIVTNAGQLGASLVVVGTRGRTGLARVALGSVAASVVRHAPCSLLAVRLHQPD